MSGPLFNGRADLGNEDLNQNLQYILMRKLEQRKDYLQMMSGSGYNGPPILGRPINTKIQEVWAPDECKETLIDHNCIQCLE